jgi:hypothetical protein
MSAPSLTAYINGQGTVTADGYNTFTSSADNVTELRAFVGLPGIQVYLRGIATVADGGQGWFYWNAGAINPVDNGVSTIVPSSSTTGCWTRITGRMTNIISCLATGTNAIVLTPLTPLPTVTSYANYQLFAFTAAASSTGSITVQYDPTGATALAALPVYLPNLSQAGSGSFSIGSLIVIAYVSSLNSGAGGFQVISALPAASTSSTNIVQPQGRLTLTSGTPVLYTDTTSATTVYYTPYIGGLIPIYNGTVFSNLAFSETALNLDSNSGHTGYQASGGIFDLFIFNNGGTATLGTGPRWSTLTSRGTGAGTTQIQQVSGIWTNANSITLRTGNASGNTTVVAANQATYVGTMYATGNGQTGVNFKPAAASGGAGNIVALWNAYNRIRIQSLNLDSSTNYTYATATWRSMDNSTANRITWLDGLQQTFVKGHLQTLASVATISDAVFIGMNLDSTSATPNVFGDNTAATSTLVNNYSSSIVVEESFPPQLGLHYLQAMEISADGVTATFNPGAQFQAFMADLDM